MKKKQVYFLGSSILIFALAQLFIYSSELRSDDELHQQHFNMKYGIFAIVQPDNLNFSGEEIPTHSPEIWERIDKELLKNTYWQSNTMLFFKKANKYFPIIEPILKKNNIPDDFKYLALIESGLDNVVSPAGAAGFWQILKSTAREHGLEVNSAIDERYNLEKSTEVACTYLNDAYDKFGSWTMAAASYNMGKNGVRRNMEKQKTNNYYNLHLNSETSRYVFRIIAVKEIMENPKKYGFMFRNKDLYAMPNYKTVQVDSTIASLSEFAQSHGVNYKLLKQFNPWLRTSSLPDKSRRKYILKIPTNTDLLVFDDIMVQDELEE
ncbi:MAG: lytic transglycosylase domain-containing protein [Flavobacteriales bacterium]|nr:lytic transglycosylase domain-containing protein [Flavobacteriales bacterium]